MGMERHFVRNFVRLSVDLEPVDAILGVSVSGNMGAGACAVVLAVLEDMEETVLQHNQTQLATSAISWGM
jgi:hypothetical protein